MDSVLIQISREILYTIETSTSTSNFQKICQVSALGQPFLTLKEHQHFYLVMSVLSYSVTAVFIKFQYFTTALDKTTILIWFQSELLNFSLEMVSIYSYQYCAVLFGRPGRVCFKNTVVTDLFTL